MSEDKNIEQSAPWPPTYTIKKHTRVRHPKLRVSPHKGLEVIVPVRFSLKQLSALLETHKTWIEKKLLNYQHMITQAAMLPTEIFLPAISQQYTIHYRQIQNERIKIIKRPQNEIVLFGQMNNKILCKKLLLQWIRIQAKQYLIPWLQQLSEQTQLTYQEVNIRSQRSRWGSCSSNKVIHLNDRLLFLPPHLVTHVLLHELCHTVHFNHSNEFWKLLASFDSTWKTNKRELHNFKMNIPAWTY